MPSSIEMVGERRESRRTFAEEGDVETMMLVAALNELSQLRSRGWPDDKPHMAHRVPESDLSVVPVA
jgi:hypothetical protein